VAIMGFVTYCVGKTLGLVARGWGDFQVFENNSFKKSFKRVLKSKKSLKS
jgi:hypothetical protein